MKLLVLLVGKNLFNSDFCDLVKYLKKEDKSTSDNNSLKILNWVKKKKPDIIFCIGWVNF